MFQVDVVFNKIRQLPLIDQYANPSPVGIKVLLDVAASEILGFNPLASHFHYSVQRVTIDFCLGQLLSRPLKSHRRQQILTYVKSRPIQCRITNPRFLLKKFLLLGRGQSIV